MTDITINTRVTWIPTQSGADQWNRAVSAWHSVAIVGQPITCSLWVFMSAIGPIVGMGSGAAMPASAIDIEVTRADQYAPVLRDLNDGHITWGQAAALVGSISPGITMAELHALLGEP